MRLWNHQGLWERAIASPAVVCSMGENLEYGLFSAWKVWTLGEEMYGSYFEYKFRGKYPLPIHIAPTAMKIISLMCNRDPDAAFNDEGEEPELWEQDRHGIHL